MKKLLLTLIVSLAFCGSFFAQEYETHWPEFSDGPFDMPTFVVSYISIDGQLLTLDDEFSHLEVASFVGDECRGHYFVIDDGDPYPTVQMNIMYHMDYPGEELSFKMWDHINGFMYEVCTPSVALYTGTDHWEIWDEEYENAVVLDFTSPAQQSYTLDIEPYTGEKDNYYLIASPIGAVAAQDVEGLMTPSYDFFSFDQAEEFEWINHRDEAEFELQPGVGYLYANNTGTDLTFVGNAVELGDVVEYELTYNPDAEFAGWNLVGNPFAEDEAYIVCRPFYVMNGETFELIAEDVNGTIPPMTGAFVVAEGEGEYVTFASNPGGINCGSWGEDDKLTLFISRGRGVIDRAIIRFGEGRQLPKFQLHENSAKVYIPMDGQDYAIVNSANQGEMPVNFKAESGTYTIGVNANGMNYLHLIDNLTGADVDLLANSSYTFDANATDYASRFKLVFATGNSDDTFAFASNGNFIISNEGDATVQVIDVNGRILSSETINGSASINVSAAPGVYMIRLINGENVRVQKVVVK